MKLFEQIDRLNRLHHLIKMKATGSPEELAIRLKLSVSMVYKLLEELKLQGAPITYSKTQRSYFYSKPFSMLIDVQWNVLVDEECVQIAAGENILRDVYNCNLIIV